MSRPPGFYAPLEEALRQVQADKQNEIGEPAPDVTRQPEPGRNAEAPPEFQPTDTLRPGFYEPLDEALRQVKADITQGIDPFDAYQMAMMQLDPTRPEGHPTDRLFHWPESQSMPHQFDAARVWDDLVNDYANRCTDVTERSEPEPAREESPQEPARADDRQEHDQPEPDQDQEPEFDFGMGRDMGGDGLGS
jgi:hypothetical protein